MTYSLIGHEARTTLAGIAPMASALYAEQEARVARGAALLDANVLGWWEVIDPSTVDVSDWDMCPLGQAFGNFSEGMDELALPYGDAEGEATRHGFNADTAQEQRVLNALWRKVIQERRDEHDG